MTKGKLYFLVLLISQVFVSCAQEGNGDSCFQRTTYPRIGKKLPSSICLPNNDYAIDDVILNLDLNQDGKNDLIINYYKYPTTPGDTSFFEAYLQKRGEFVSIGTYSNIDPPILGSNVYAASDSPDSLVRYLVHSYPYDIEISFEGEVLLISHLIPEDFGKTYVFLFNEKLLTWTLDRTEFWAGNMDRRDWERLDLSEELLGKVILEVKKPAVTLLLEDFDLIESRMKADGEESVYFERKYDIYEIGRR